MSELNPNHPVTQELCEQWHKIVALIMRAQGLTELIISPSEVQEAFSTLDGLNVTIRINDRQGVVLQLVSDKEAERLVREEGGLPT